MVPGRSEVQCRERFMNALGKRDSVRWQLFGSRFHSAHVILYIFMISDSVSYAHFVIFVVTHSTARACLHTRRRGSTADGCA